MIVDIGFALIGALFNIISAFLSALSFVIPDVMDESFSLLISYVYYFQGIFPVQEMFNVIGFLAIFYGVWYTAKAIMTIYSMLPFIGKKVNLK